MTNSLFLRGVALVYFIAFVSLLPQISGLIGAHGILPANSFLDAIHHQLGIEGYWLFPTLTWINSSNTFLLFMCWAGAGLSVLLFTGFIPVPALIGLWILYLSIANVGQ